MKNGKKCILVADDDREIWQVLAAQGGRKEVPAGPDPAAVALSVGMFNAFS